MCYLTLIFIYIYNLFNKNRKEEIIMTRDAKCTFLEMFWKFWKDSGICSLFADSCCTSLISVQSDSLYNENAPPPIPTANDYKAKFMTVTQIRLEILKEK